MVVLYPCTGEDEYDNDLSSPHSPVKLFQFNWKQ